MKRNIIIIGCWHDTTALAEHVIRLVEDTATAIHIVAADEKKVFEEVFEKPIPYHAPVFELTARGEYDMPFYEPPTNKPKWFQGSETAKFNVPGKKQYCKYNTRKKSRNNKHK